MISLRQLEIIDLMRRGFSNTEIGRQLGIRKKTVVHHCSILYETLGVDSDRQLMALVMEARPNDDEFVVAELHSGEWKLLPRKDIGRVPLFLPRGRQ